jgi:hypothetical protein
MTSNLKVILSAVGVAALVASPAMAKSHVHTNQLVPADARGAAAAYGAGIAAPYAYAPHQLVTPYAPNLPEQTHEMPGQSRDFQLGGEK